MESTVLVDFDSESKLMFATNSSGVILVTNAGNVVYSADEFQYYQCLFKLIDTESIGKLRVDSTTLTSILSRTKLKSDVVQKLLILSMNCINPKSAGLRSCNSKIVSSDSEEVSYISEKEMNDGMCIEIGHANSSTSESDDASSFLTLHQWLLLCKTILQQQMNPTVEPDHSIEEVISKISDFDNHVTSATNCALSVSKNRCNQGNDITLSQETDGCCQVSAIISTHGYFANFQLGVTVSSPHPTISEAKVTGWEVHCEGFQKSHTKFAISLSLNGAVSADVSPEGGDDVHVHVPDDALPPRDNNPPNLQPSVISDVSSVLHVVEAADAGYYVSVSAEESSSKLSSSKKSSKTLKRKNASTKKATPGKAAVHLTKNVFEAESSSCSDPNPRASTSSSPSLVTATAPSVAIMDVSHLPHSSTLNAHCIPDSALSAQQLSNGDAQHPPLHVNNISTDTHLPSAGPTVTVSISKGPNHVAVESLQSHRRYSDFELLVSVLRRLYRGVILPPLPPKNWTTQLQQHTQPSKLLAAQRQAELQLFLSALLVHPVLRHSFEVILFLRTSLAGLNSFRHTFSLLTFDSEGRVVANHRNKNVVKSSTQFISEASLTARAAAAGIVSSIWDLGSAILQNGMNLRLRSGSNLSESSVYSDRERERDVMPCEELTGHLSVMPYDVSKKSVGLAVSNISSSASEELRQASALKSTVIKKNGVVGADGLYAKGSPSPSDQAIAATSVSPVFLSLQVSSSDALTCHQDSGIGVKGYNRDAVTTRYRSDSVLSTDSLSSSVRDGSSNRRLRVGGHNLTPSFALSLASDSLDPIEGSTEHLLKILSAVKTVGDRLDALVTADGNNLYALSQFGYYLKQSSDAYTADRSNLRADILSLNRTIEIVAKSQQVFFDEEQRLSVNPMQFLGRYLQSTNTALAQRARAVAAVDQAVLEEQLKKKALDMTRKTKGATEDSLNRCSEDLGAAEEEVSACRREEAAVAAMLKSEGATLIIIQTRSVQTHLQSLATSRVSQHSACLKAWEDLKNILLTAPLGSDALGVPWPGVGACDSSFIEDFL